MEPVLGERHGPKSHCTDLIPEECHSDEIVIFLIVAHMIENDSRFVSLRWEYFPQLSLDNNVVHVYDESKIKESISRRALMCKSFTACVVQIYAL